MWRHRWRHQSTCHRHFSTRSLLDTNPLNRLVSEIFSIKVHRHIDTSTDNKGRLKPAAREPWFLIVVLCVDVLTCCACCLSINRRSVDGQRRWWTERLGGSARCWWSWRSRHNVACQSLARCRNLAPAHRRPPVSTYSCRLSDRKWCVMNTRCVHFSSQKSYFC